MQTLELTFLFFFYTRQQLKYSVCSPPFVFLSLLTIFYQSRLIPLMLYFCSQSSHTAQHPTGKGCDLHSEPRVFSSTHTSNQKAQNRSDVITVCATRFHSSNTSVCQLSIQTWQITIRFLIFKATVILSITMASGIFSGCFYLHFYFWIILCNKYICMSR